MSRDLRPLRVQGMRALACVVAIGLATSGCERKCGPEVRQTASTTTIRDPQATAIAEVFVNLAEARGEENSRILSVSFNGPGNQAASPLRGHVRAARLIRDGGETLLELEVHDSPDYAQVIVITKTESSLAATRFEAIRQSLIGGQLSIEIETDLAGMELIRTRMPGADAGGFRRASCPGFLD